jgi:exo-1,4-beta-D-glucosaminidase
MFLKALAALAVCCSVAAIASETAAPLARTPLRASWTLQSACKLQADGEAISTPAFHPEGWYSISVPATVIAAQVQAGAIEKPYYAMNLRQIRGTTYPIGENFSNLPMPADSPYACGWWYRKEFTIPAADKGKTLWLHFGGINYRADIWLNGKKIADKSQIAGAYRTYDLDITSAAIPGKPNVLGVETFAPTEKDLGINWVDWNPCPADKDMGLWGDVDLVTSGHVSLRSPLAVTHFPDSSLNEADLTVYAELHNATDQPLHGTVSGTVANIPISQAIDLAPHEDKTVVFSPDNFAQLKLKDPQVWWPYQMGTPHLEKLRLKFTENGKLSDEASVNFGIREITSELTDNGSRLFRVNGKPILIRGAGWSQDMLLRQDPARLRDEIKLVQDMHLNTIRLEGKMETEDFFQLADERGILVMLGWCCCDQWEHWKDWTPENHAVSAESLRSQILRIRHHASLLVWLNGSDGPPPADVENAYLRIEAENHWPNPILSSASAEPTIPTGKSGVKMTGPYDYVAPSYWYVDVKYGGAHGFNTETSPGPAIPNLASLKKFIPPAQLWPTDETWSFHYGGEGFKNLTVFNDAMSKVLAAPKSAEEYVRFSQTMSYDSERAMYEAYSRNKYNSTGVIQWMLNNAWPSMIWHLYDYYLDPDGGYFAVKKACEPLHVQYSYDDHSIVVVNSTYKPEPGLTASVHVYDLDLKPLFSADKQLDSPADSSTKVIPIADSIFQSGAKVYFVDLSLKNAEGKLVSRNFYWIPATLTTFDWAKTDYTHTPALQHEDLSALLTLPKAEIQAKLRGIAIPQGRQLTLELHNRSKALAFQIAAAARTASGELIAPVLWSDNYIELMPGESRTLIAILPANAPSNASVVLSGWNIAEQTLSLAGAARSLATLTPPPAGVTESRAANGR